MINRFPNFIDRKRPSRPRQDWVEETAGHTRGRFCAREAFQPRSGHKKAEKCARESEQTLFSEQRQGQQFFAATVEGRFDFLRLRF